MIRVTLNNRVGTITNLNQRVEKHGPEEKEVGTDIDIEMMFPVDDLNMLAVDCDFIDYAEMFYDNDGALNRSGIQKLVFDRTYEEHILDLKFDNVSQQGVTIEEVTLKKFSATLDAGKQVKLHFQAQCHADDEAISFLRKALVKDQIIVEVKEPRQQDMLSGGDEAAA